MGDYAKPSLTTWGYFTTAVTREYSTNGDKSIKATLTQEVDRYISFRFTDNIIGETITFSVDTQSEKQLRLYIYHFTDDWHGNSVLIPSGSQTTVLTKTIPFDATNVWFRIEAVELHVGEYFFTDNWRLTIG